jgi:hypothetical protein
LVFHGLHWFTRPGFERFGRAGTPFGFAAETVDTEFLEELEMGAKLISGHD